MKIFTLILSIYLMVLSAAPCTDTHDERVDRLWGDEGHQHDDDSHEDDCPPLCSCNCCGIVLSYTYVDFGFKELKQIPKIHEKNEAKRPFFIASYFHHIWQPPKI